MLSLSGIRTGLLTLFCRHTSASLLIQENAAPAARRDLESYFARIAPEERPYEHDDEGPDDMPAHLRAALTQTQLSIPVANGRLLLGTWQGIYLFEHRRDTPERRDRAPPDRRMSASGACGLARRSRRGPAADRGRGPKHRDRRQPRRKRSASSPAGSPRRSRCERATILSCSSHRGDARLDNRKCKDAFGARPRMLGAEETLAITGHPVGGVCPFGLTTAVPVYLDPSLPGLRPRLSRRADRSIRRSRRRRAAVRAGRRALGRPMPATRGSGRGLALPALTSARATARPGSANPRPAPWPARSAARTRPAPRARRSHPHPGKSGDRVAIRREGPQAPPSGCGSARPSRSCAPPSAMRPSATSYSSGCASHGSVGTSSIGEANSRPVSGAK